MVEPQSTTPSLDDVDTVLVHMIVNDAPILSEENLGQDFNQNIVETVSETTTTQINQIINEINGIIDSGKQAINGTLSEAKKSTSFWTGWPTEKILLIVLMSLCALGIIISVLYILLGKQFKKSRGAARELETRSKTQTGAAMGGATDPQYRQLPTRNPDTNIA
ncbi:unnamed protein product [Didymodactylos carnosus]|uniref:Uncharacterized protein n=1 Tax=Didymodactylos carnosus TaxID=1234261 RepID=A0A815JMD3_9BILA|nr:unnamed protein product [Didymodactylos carnosus]CAF1384031.1 unnamed protein product [Didymodactylos carnosus]CAF3739614.1 unnamed protein product [Didymodactylos carnosus]CAF4279101.1 unnamed protein product [Didymodactylos carnosus]